MVHPTPPKRFEGRTLANAILDQVVLLLINGMSLESAESFCQARGHDLDEARRTVAEARQRITVAADFARDERLGQAVMRLDDLYTKSIAAKDTRTALQAQRELSRLLGLYGAGGDDPPNRNTSGDSDGADRLALIGRYLLPLGLADERYPVEEHARIAAEIIRLHKLARLPDAQGTGAPA